MGRTLFPVSQQRPHHAEQPRLSAAFIFNLSNDYYLRSSVSWIFDLEGRNYAIPIGTVFRQGLAVARGNHYLSFRRAIVDRSP
jgi:hypothetical protein